MIGLLSVLMNQLEFFFIELDPETASVLVSCIYFKGDWFDKFDNTYKAFFYCTEIKTFTVKMMSQTNLYPYISVDKKKV